MGAFAEKSVKKYLHPSLINYIFGNNRNTWMMQDQFWNRRKECDYNGPLLKEVQLHVLVEPQIPFERGTNTFWLVHKYTFVGAQILIGRGVNVFDRSSNTFCGGTNGQPAGVGERK